MISRSLPHATTGVSPAELLFGRKIRTKLPDIVERPYHEDLETRDRDAENKGKSCMIADTRRNARPSPINLGDEVLVRQDKQNKLITTFNEVPHTVVSKTGNSVVVEAPSGAQYSRNTTHVKRFERPSVVNIPTSDEETLETNDTTMPAGPSVVTPPVVTARERPRREKVVPEKFKDFVMNK